MSAFRDRSLRIAVLYARLTGYVAACLRALCTRYDVELLVVRLPPGENVPFEDRHFDWIDRLYDRNALGGGDMKQKVQEFGPDALFISGWFDGDYLRVARSMRREGVMVIAGSDAQWTGSWDQQLGRALAPWYLHSAIDVFWVAGERQRQLADRLGYRGERCWSGVYACDWESFAETYSESESEERAFLYVGRYERHKGLDVLLEAYGRYRRRVEGSWSLICAGTGPLEGCVDAQASVQNAGFVQPDRLPELMAEAGAFVLPSRREPWGVVVQEAAAAGLPLICSEVCGAAVHLLQDGYNGYLVEPESSEHLARRMAALSRSDPDRRARMGLRSHQLSSQYTPARWAETLVSGIRDWYSHDGE